jgi:nucleotide sugar dehydrogenase
MQNHHSNTLIIGLGQIGYNNAEYMTQKGLDIDGYDINDKALERALNARVIRGEAETFEGYDYYVICTSTHKPENEKLVYLEGLYQLARRLASEGKKGALVSIESTVTRGITREIFEILNHRLHVVHFPHRFYEEEKDVHGVRQTRVLGSCANCCRKKAVEFYQGLLDIPIHVVTTVEVAELSKIVENSLRYLEIAFAEELSLFCEATSTDFDELREAVNSKWNVKVLEARDGISGHCLPKDAQMYIELANEANIPSMIECAKRLDTLYSGNLQRREQEEIKAVIPLLLRNDIPLWTR